MDAILKIIGKLLLGLITERFAKRTIVALLEAAASRTKWATDDKLVSYIKEEWKA